MMKPKEKTDDGTAHEGRKDEQADWSPRDQAHDQHADDNHQSDWMRGPLSAAVRSKGHEMLWLGIGGVFGGSDHQVEGTPLRRAAQYSWEQKKRPSGLRAGPFLTMDEF